MSNEEKCIYCREYGNLPCEECEKKAKEKAKVYLDLSKLSGEEIKEVIEITNISDEYLKYAPYLIYLNDKWITSNGGYVHRVKLTEITLPEFRELFESKEVPDRESEFIEMLENATGLLSILPDIPEHLKETYGNLLMNSEALIQSVKQPK